MSTLIDVNDLRARLQSQTPPQVLDVREFPEYVAGHLPAARCMPLSDIEVRATTLDQAQPTVVLCRSGKRSKEAARRLEEMGFTDVLDLLGGTTAWEAAGFPLQREAGGPWSLERQVRLLAGFLVLCGVILSQTVAPAFVWLSAFIGAGLMFAAITDTCGMALLLARLPWNRQQSCGRGAITCR
jgi:rhodanese-related sulfurtransferase